MSTRWWDAVIRPGHTRIRPAKMELEKRKEREEAKKHIRRLERRIEIYEKLYPEAKEQADALEGVLGDDP